MTKTKNNEVGFNKRWFIAFLLGLAVLIVGLSMGFPYYEALTDAFIMFFGYLILIYIINPVNKIK